MTNELRNRTRDFIASNFIGVFFLLACVLVFALIFVTNVSEKVEINNQDSNNIVSVNGWEDYAILVENLGNQVRITDELNSLQREKIKKLQQQIEILDNAGLRSCSYLKRITANLSALNRGLEDATLENLELEKVRTILNTLRITVVEASNDIDVVFLSTPIYHTVEIEE